MRNPIKDKIAKHSNIVEMNREAVIERYAEFVQSVKFEETWPDVEGFVNGFGGDIYNWFEKQLLPQVISEAARFYKDMTGERAPSVAYPNWRLEFLEEKLKHAGNGFAMNLRIQEKKYRMNGAGDAGIRAAFEKDFTLSEVAMQEKKDGSQKLVVGYGRWYSDYWGGVYKIVAGYYTEANTSFTTSLFTR